jgi:lysozyme
LEKTEQGKNTEMKCSNRKHIYIAFSIVSFLILIGILFSLLLFNGIIWFVYPEHKGFSVKGVDVARYQGDIDWHELALQGIQFAFIKATEGSGYQDPKFMGNIALSRSNGVYAGAYHFFSGESSGKTQAINFISTTSDYEMDLPPVLDFEIGKADKETIIAEAMDFLRDVELYFGVKPIIYATYNSYNSYLAGSFDGYPLWIRDLMKEPKMHGNREWLFWQYCNRGRLKGIDRRQKYVDLNVFNGTQGDFDEYVNAIRARRT